MVLNNQFFNYIPFVTDDIGAAFGGAAALGISLGGGDCAGGGDFGAGGGVFGAGGGDSSTMVDLVNCEFGIITFLPLSSTMVVA